MSKAIEPGEYGMVVLTKEIDEDLTAGAVGLYDDDEEDGDDGYAIVYFGDWPLGGCQHVPHSYLRRATAEEEKTYRFLHMRNPSRA